MVLAAQAVKMGSRCDFSAGNTGALLAAGLFIVGRIKNVERPGLMSTLPVMGEPDKGFDMLDLEPMQTINQNIWFSMPF